MNDEAVGVFVREYREAHVRRTATPPLLTASPPLPLPLLLLLTNALL